MKKKLLFALLLAVVLTCVFAVSVSAEVTTYDDAPYVQSINVLMAKSLSSTTALSAL